MNQNLSLDVRRAEEKKKKQELYRTIRHYNEERHWPIKWMCEKLGISRASYYKWLNRKETALEKENKRILEVIREIAESNNSLFGYRKMKYAVERVLGKTYNFKRIRRLMCINNIHSNFRRKGRKSTYKKCTPEETAENTLARGFNVDGPNKVYCTDVTEMKFCEGKQKVYISMILDLYDRTLQGLSVSERNDVSLVQRSLEELIKNNNVEGAIFHSDRGFQYTRRVFKKFLEDNGMEQSMSRVGRCIDNGPMESIQGIIKDILKVLIGECNTYEEVVEALNQTIDYYNNEYPQARFKGKTASEVRKEALQAAEPIQYPIAKNPKVEAYWAKIRAIEERKASS